MTEPTFRSDVTVDLVKHAAADEHVLFAARVSTQGERSLENLSTWDQSVTDIEHPQAARNRGLINYLMRDRHGSPFEATSMTFFISAPIFVFREFHRHRAGWSYSEESGRYRQLEPVFYLPGPERKLVQQGKPGRYEFVDGPPGLKDVAHEQMEIAMVGEQMEEQWAKLMPLTHAAFNATGRVAP
jgi:thymidylate synthase (FAD)